jgi:hypothetical protein
VPGLVGGNGGKDRVRSGFRPASLLLTSEVSFKS